MPTKPVRKTRGSAARKEPTKAILDLFADLRDALLVVHDGAVTHANKAAAELLGRCAKGLPLQEVFHPEDVPAVQQLLTNRDGAPTKGSARVHRSDGRHLACVLYAAQLPTPHKDHVRIAIHPAQVPQDDVAMHLARAEEVNRVLHEEIRKHRITQDELRRSRRFARSVIESSLDMIMAADPEGRISEFNPAAALRFGYEADEVMGRHTRMLYADPEDFRRVQQELDKHGIFAGEIRNITRKGEVFISFLAASRLYDADGQLLGAMGVSRDITQAKRDSEALRASEERYRDLFENATDLIQILAPDGTIRYVNRAWRDTLGHGVDDAGLRMDAILEPQARERFHRACTRALAGEGPQPVDTVLVDRNGATVKAEGTVSLRIVDGRQDSLRCILRNVTDIRQARAQVLGHEARMRALFESSSHMFWSVDRDIKLTAFNRSYAGMIERLHGVAPQVNRDPGKPRQRFAPPEHHAFWEARYREAFAGEQVHFETELEDQQGRRVCNEVFLSPVFDPHDGQVREVFGIGMEITAKKQGQELLRARSARLKAIFESAANMMLWTLGPDMRITSCNERFRQCFKAITGHTFQVDDTFVEALTGHATATTLGALRTRYAQVLDGRANRSEVELADKQGNSIWLELFLDPMVIGDKVTEISCLAHVITDKKESEQRLLASLHEKDVLLREVHHRVKNNLQVIISMLNLQQAAVGDDPALLALLGTSTDRIRAMAFIHETLYQNKELGSLDLGSYMGDLAHSLVMNYRLSDRVRLETDLQRVDLGLEQAVPCGLILNELIGNALKHAYAPGQEGCVRIALEEEGGRIAITVADDGRGLPGGFDDQRQGGLGLQLVHSLVEQLDGTLQRTVSRGVTYLLTFERTK